jgi:hypothetical protein
MLSKESIEEFKEIYKKDYGVDLTNEEATKFATKFLNLMKIVYRPIKKSDSNNKSDNFS